MRQSTRQFYEFGPFRLDPVDRLLHRDGEVVPLTAKIFDILLVFVQNSGRTLEKEEMMREVWPNHFVEEGNLTRNISTLRKALGESQDNHRYVVTIPGRGYRFVAEVREVAVENGNSNSQSIAAARPSEVVGDSPQANGIAQTRAGSGNKGHIAPTPRISVLVLIALAAAAVVYALFIREKHPPHPAIASVAVLPLENLSGDPQQEYFADGMTDALIGDLARIGALRVISRTSVMHYKGTKKSLPEVAAELKVDAVVEGTVQRSGDRVRIRAQLIHAATDRHLWGETYERDLRDVLGLQAEVAQTIARQIQIKITPDEQERMASARPVNNKAYNDYLLGVYYWNKRTEEHLRKAIDYFQSAIREDPSYAPAYAGLADCHSVLAIIFGDPREFAPKAKAAARKAIDIDESLAEAHGVLASVIAQYDWDWQGAEREFNRAIELNRGSPTAHLRFSLILAEMGRTEESLTEIKRALDLDPISLMINTSFGSRLYYARQYDQATKQLLKTLEMDPNFLLARIYLGRVYAHQRRYSESLAELNKAAELSRDSALADLGYVYAASDQRREARRILAELGELSRRRYVSPVDIAFIHAGLGEKDQAFNWLEKAYGERSSKLAQLKMDPRFDILRTDPRFDNLLRRIGLPNPN